MADLNFTFGADGRELNRAIEDARSRFGQLGDAAVKIGENFTQVEFKASKAMKGIKDQASSARDAFDNFDKSLSIIQDKLISLYAAKQLLNWMDWANNINQTAKAVGMTTGGLIELQNAVMQAGGTALAASRGIEMFYMKLDQARQGGLQQQEAFKRLGISLDDLAKMDDRDLFKKTIELLAQMPASAARNRIEVELLSKSFRGIPLTEINEQLDKTKGSFNEFGPVLDDAGKAYRNLMQDLNNFKIAILGVFQPLFKAMGDSTISVKEFQAILKDVIAVIAGILAFQFGTQILGWATAMYEFGKAVKIAEVGLKGFAIAEQLAANATGIGALVNLIGKAVAAVAVFAGAEYVMNKAIDSNTDANKEAAKAAADKTAADNAAATAGNKVYDATAKMNAMIRTQTEEFKKNVQAQIDNIKAKDSTTGLGSEAKAKMDEELRIRDEFRRKIAELNVKLQEAQSAGPAQEIYHQQDALRKSIDDLTKSEANYVAKAGDAAAVRAKNNSADQMALLLKEDQIKIEKAISDIQTNIDSMTLSSDQKKIANIEKQTNEYIKLATEKRRAQLGSEATDEELKNDKVLQDTIKGIRAKQQAVVDATKTEIAASRDWSNGWRLAFNQYKQDAQDGASVAKKLFDDSTKGMEDAIVTFAKTGKWSMQDMLNTLAEDILRSQIKQLFANMFTGAGATGGGSMFGAIGKMLGFADGGTIPTNAPVLVGERGPEIISGAAGRTVTPNDKLGSASTSNTTHVTYNINATDARSFQQMLAQDPSFLYAVTLRGQQLIPGGV